MKKNKSKTLYAVSTIPLTSIPQIDKPLKIVRISSSVNTGVYDVNLL